MEDLELIPLFSDRYRNKNVLVTGHTGFKGSWLSLWLLDMGANVTGYSLEPPTEPNHYSLLDLPISSVIADIKDLNALHRVFARHRPEIVFHLAAQSLVRASYESPVDTFTTNIVGTINVLEACRQCSSVTAVIVVTSDKCYENREWIWGYRESDPMGGHDPYSASKGCCELVTASYRKSFSHARFLIASARAGNVIGGGDWGIDRLVPDICRNASTGTVVEIRNPDAIRPWQHVLEPLSGYLLLGQQLLAGNTEMAEGWNFGPMAVDQLSVRSLAERLQNHWPLELGFGSPAEDLHEAEVLRLDCSKAYAKLHWQPLWGHDQMLAATMQWYREYYENSCVMTRQQLAAYIADARKRETVWTRQ